MIAAVKHSRVHGRLTIPGSKSETQRAYALALLSDGDTIVNNPSISEDSNAVLHIIEKLGAKAGHEENSIRITGNPKFNFSGTLNCGESGLALRMLVPVLATCPGSIVLTGEGSLVHRPMDFFDAVLPNLGVNLRTSGGFLPVEIRGPMQPKNITVDGSVSSQFITGLLFSYAHVATAGTAIRVTHLVSRPYLSMSVAILNTFGYEILQPSANEFVIGKKGAVENPLALTVSGDWSGGAFFLVAGAISGSLEIHGLNSTSYQGDQAILNVLKEAGANISVSESVIKIDDQNALEAFHYDASDTPDLFPPLVALAIYCKGISTIEGLSRLQNKESNRQEALINVFTEMGARVWVDENSLKIEGGHLIKPATVNGYNDHRIVMAAAVAALASNSIIAINGAEAISKSYPAFFQQLSQIGAHVSLT